MPPKKRDTFFYQMEQFHFDMLIMIHLHLHEALEKDEETVGFLLDGIKKQEEIYEGLKAQYSLN